MQEDTLEVTFCDLCGASVPIADLSSRAAVQHLGKTVGACCMMALRAAAGGVHAAAAVDGARADVTPGPLLPVAIVLLAAMAAATIFLDQKITGADAQWRTNHDQILAAQRSDSDVLRALGSAMDGVARKADLDGLAAKLTQVDGALHQADEQLRQQSDQAQKDLATMRQDVRGVAAATIDYRPLFEDLRQQQQRLAELVAAIEKGAVSVAVTPKREPVASPTPGVDGPDMPALPAALADQVKKLQSTDPAVRFEAVDELLRSKSAQVLPHLLPSARDPDSFVRRLTVEGLRDFKRPEVVDALLVAMADSDDSVRDTAWRSLKEVSGQKFPFETAATKDARARAVQRWQEWWDKNKATFGA